MRKFLLSWLPLILVILISYGCTSLQNVSRFSARSLPTVLSIEQVEPAGQPGTYALRGKASLPDKTRVSVSALRNFAASSLGSEQTYAALPFVILDRQFAEVEQGTWQTTLGLWQVSPEGQYGESWQFNQPLPPAGSEPSPNVTFLVTLEPAAFSQIAEPRLLKILDQTEDDLMGFTEAGEPYLRTGRMIAVALPSANAQSGQLLVDPVNNPWDGRSNLNAAAGDLNRAPTLPFDGTDNLPLPPSNMLR